MDIGQYILEKLTSTSLFDVRDKNGNPVSPCIIVWSSGAAEQLEAIALDAIKQGDKDANP